MSSYLDYLNLIGKIDATKTMVTPDQFQFKLKEALTLNDIDYDKLKSILKQDPSFKPSDFWIENEKDKRFQELFSTMWPNLYKNLEEKRAAEAAAAEAQKSKIVCSLLIDQEVKKYEELLKSKLCHVQPAAVTSSYPLDAYFTSTSLSKPSMTTTTITTTFCPCTGCKTNPPPPPPPANDIKYPHLSSSYDFPYNTHKYVSDLVKSSYNTDTLSKETELLKSIQETQDKLKMTLKIEKTTDLVDDIITKVGALQCEMRKKSSELKLKEEIIKRNKEHEDLKNLLELKQNLLTSSLKSDSEHHYHHHHCHDHHKRHRSKSREIIIHDCVSRSRPSSRSSRSSSRHRSSSASGRHCSRSKSRSRMIRQSIHSVKPKVNCWNLNCKHDENIY